MDNGAGGAGLLLLGITAMVFYLIPLAIAFLRYHHQLGPIAVINFFLGWTFIGWVVALAMAVSSTPGRKRNTTAPTLRRVS